MGLGQCVCVCEGGVCVLDRGVKELAGIVLLVIECLHSPEGLCGVVTAPQMGRVGDSSVRPTWHNAQPQSPGVLSSNQLPA